MEPSNPPHVLHLIEAKLRAELERDVLRAEVQRLTEESRRSDAGRVPVPREEMVALRKLFAAAGNTIYAASSGRRATLEEINEAWAEVCAAQIALRSSTNHDSKETP